MRPGKPAWDWIRAAFEKEKVSLPEFSTDEELIEPSSTLNVDMTATDEVRDASGAQRRARVLHAVFTTWRTKHRFTPELQQWFLGHFRLEEMHFMRPAASAFHLKRPGRRGLRPVAVTFPLGLALTR